MRTHITLLHAVATRVCSHDGKSVMISMPHCDEVRVAQTAVPHGAWPEVGLKVHVGMDIYCVRLECQRDLRSCEGEL